MIFLSILIYITKYNIPFYQKTFHDLMGKNNKLYELSKKEIFKGKYKNIVVSGGSIKGISHIGAIKTLIENELIIVKEIKSIAGASVGAPFGLLLILGFSIDEIWEFIYNLNFSKMVKPDFMMIFKKCGVETGNIIYDLFENILFVKTGIKNINFLQLFEITKIHYIAVGSCLTTKEIVYYDHINTPDFKVAMAIRISISMPGFFIPVEIDNKKYVDGAILNNYPMNLFKDKLDETIGILIYSDYDTDYKYPEQYFMAIINLFLQKHYKMDNAKYIENTVVIKKTPITFIFNFNVSNETKQILYQNGVDAAQEFINNLFNH